MEDILITAIEELLGNSPIKITLALATAPSIPGFIVFVIAGRAVDCEGTGVAGELAGELV